MRFLIVERQGGGCDYTIGCGMRVTEAEAESYASLADVLRERAERSEHDGPGADFMRPDLINSVTVYSVGESVEVPVEAWRAEAWDRERKRQSSQAEKAERAQYEALKKRFG